MNEINLKKLYTEISKVYDIGNYDEFKSKMGTKELRKKFFDAMSAENFDLGDYGRYESRLSTVVTGSQVSQGWVKDPTGNKTWEYQVRDCKWIAKKIGVTTEYVLSDNPKYASSVQKLNKAYPNLIANCNKTKVDPNTTTDPNSKYKEFFAQKRKEFENLPKTISDIKGNNNSTPNVGKITAPEIENLDGENPNDV